MIGIEKGRPKWLWVPTPVDQLNLSEDAVDKEDSQVEPVGT